MSSVQERLQLKRVPLDSWNIREQLCLASAVVRSGDQNWMSVSRALKTVGDANRPPDWYSQKSCAAQYEALLDHVETPKRKKRSSEGAVETPQESILKRLTQERIVEIQKTVAEMTQQYEQLKNEVIEARNPSTSDDRLREVWAEIEAAKRARERENARRVAWLKEREERRARAERTWRPPSHTPPATAAAVAGPAAPSSPLLTSLLKSSPVVTTPQHIPHPATVVETVSPSAGAPTLSMLLEKSAPPTPTPSLATTIPTNNLGGPTPSLVLSASTLGGSPTRVGVTTPAHDNKHAAIEHIKSQLVQIEQQLIASSSTPPPPVIPPAPAVDIDDIEIKAEDVYAFRDIDIHIPPVNTIHKPNVNRVLEKPAYKKDDDQEIATTEELDVQNVPNFDKIKEEQEPTITEMSIDEVLPIEFDPCEVEDAVVEEPPPLAVREDTNSDPGIASSTSTPEIKIGFPAPEIKVLSDTPRKIKEEVQETEIEPEPEREQDVEIDVEAAQLAEEGGGSVISPAPPREEPPAPPLPPADIPLPDSPQPHTEPPLPPEPAPEITPEEVKQEPDYEDIPEPTPNEVVVKVEDDEKKGDDAEDTVPLKEMVHEEPPPETEVSHAHLPEAEETHTETDDDTPMELSREEAKDGKKRRDYSRKKKPDSRTCSGSESAAEASAPESPAATDADKQHRLWKKSVMLVYSRLCAHKYASLFLRPISDEEAPGYSLVIKRPMDLTTIRKNIDSGAIRTTSEFQRDVLLMLSNALMYNSSEHSVYQMAKDMHEEAESGLGMLLAAHSHAGLVSPPARRKRRRHEPPTPAAT